MDSTVKRGDIFYADLSPVVGSEQGEPGLFSLYRTIPETGIPPR